LHKNIYGLIHIKEFLDCHAADFTEEYIEQPTVQMKQKIKILMLLWSGLSSEERTTGGSDLVGNFFVFSHFMDRCLKFKHELEAVMELCRMCTETCRRQSNHTTPLLSTWSKYFLLCCCISEAEHSNTSLQDGDNDILELHEILKSFK
jgi:hypothetical protein